MTSATPLPPFEQVVERHGADVWRFARAQVGAGRADDVYQDVMLAALAAYPDLRDANALRSWLIRIAARKVIDVYRSTARASQRPDASVDAIEPAPADPDDELWNDVRALPPKQREAVGLRFVFDLSYAEIASVMTSSPEAARRNVFEGLRTLRTRVKEPR